MIMKYLEYNLLIVIMIFFAVCTSNALLSAKCFFFSISKCMSEIDCCDARHIRLHASLDFGPFPRGARVT